MQTPRGRECYKDTHISALEKSPLQGLNKTKELTSRASPFISASLENEFPLGYHPDSKGPRNRATSPDSTLALPPPPQKFRVSSPKSEPQLGCLTEQTNPGDRPKQACVPHRNQPSIAGITGPAFAALTEQTNHQAGRLTRQTNQARASQSLQPVVAGEKEMRRL
jgi:hypothetical protein